MTPKDENESRFSRKDVYTRVTDRIIADLEKGIRAWMKPWSGEHAAGRISRPLRHNGTPYRGMNILLLWAEAMEKGYKRRFECHPDGRGVRGNHDRATALHT